MYIQILAATLSPINNAPGLCAAWPPYTFLYNNMADQSLETKIGYGLMIHYIHLDKKTTFFFYFLGAFFPKELMNHNLFVRWTASQQLCRHGGQIFIVWSCTCSTSRFYIGILKRSQNVLMVLLHSTFVTADYGAAMIKLREHVESTARTLMSLSKADSPKILYNNKIREAFWIRPRSKPSNQLWESGLFCRWQVIKSSIIITLWFLFLCGGWDSSFRK